MMLYLTGASSSIAKTNDSPQTDVSQSLGGYISTSMVPNGSINSLFDMISLSTLKNRYKETIAIALVNKFDVVVKDVSIKMVTKKDYIGKFKIAAVGVGDDFLMEHIPNRYSEPIQAEFHDVDFYRASVKAEIINPAEAGEIISFQPFDINVEVTESGIDGTMEAIINAFSLSSDYSAKRLSEKEFEVISKAENVVEEPEECYAVGSENSEITFDGKYKNGKDNTALISEVLEPGHAIGIWLQREIVPNKISNEELIENFDKKVEIDKTEDVELVFDYSLVESEPELEPEPEPDTDPIDDGD